MSRAQKEATRRRPDGRIEWTNARGADGIPVDLTVFDCERLGSEAAIVGYQKWREKQIADKEAREADEQRYEDYREAFIASGGAKSDAKSAYADMKRREAAQAAESADKAAASATRARISGRL